MNFLKIFLLTQKLQKSEKYKLYFTSLQLWTKHITKLKCIWNDNLCAIKYSLEKCQRKPVGSTSSLVAASTSVLALTACGSGFGESKVLVKGFPKSYVAPKSDYVTPTESDPNFEALKPVNIEPYWVASLEMDEWNNHITPMLAGFDRLIQYSFPNTAPKYDTFGITGWGPATEEMKIATRDILIKLEEILEINFSESNDPEATNVISVSTSNQAKTAGFSYFPNIFFEIGMDVFIDNEYSNPSFLSELLTNYDYEVLVHEIGHALGLKHPFEANGTNSETLNTYEDNTRNTAMSYNENPVTFNGIFRPLDWMALTKFYGVQSTYKSGDDIYEFASSGGIFILDGAGLDTISAVDTPLDVTVDLRPGAHSHLGTKSNYITDVNQLTISHGSDIENVFTGSGDDTVIGTDLGNVISTGSGDDTIFAGGGADTINSGIGADLIDLSESVQAQDIVTLHTSSVNFGVDTIYGFAQGVSGDIFDISAILGSFFELFPLVASGFAPTATFGGGILRVVGSDVSDASGLLRNFQVGGGFETLSIETDESALIISASTQATGEDQYVFTAESSGGEISVTQLAMLQGNALDIDQWHASNFSFIT